MSKPVKKSAKPKNAGRGRAKAAAKTIESLDDSNPLARSSPGKLAGLLKLKETEVEWNHDDLAAILRHQLQQPLETVSEEYLQGSTTLLKKGHKPIQTFGDLFSRASPPAEILDIVRHFARDSRDAGELTLPPVIAGALYWLAIAAARATGTACRTTLSKMEMEVGLQWLSDQTWVEDSLRKIARKALRVNAKNK